MTMPTVSHACIMATMEKALGTPIEEFSLSVLREMIEEQPDLAGGMTFVISEMTGMNSPHVDRETANHSSIIATAIIGMMYKCIKAQFEANELDELFSEEGE